MSYMNHLEKKLRYSNAFSSLNSLRNRIGFGDSAHIETAERDIILDAIEIAMDKSEESFKKALMYGFHNTGDSLKTSALELAKVINNGLERGVVTSEDISTILYILRQEGTPIAVNQVRLTAKIDSLMVLLNKAKKEEIPGSNSSLIKS